MKSAALPIALLLGTLLLPAVAWSGGAPTPGDSILAVHGAEQASDFGDFVSSASALDTSVRYFIEVPPGVPLLAVDIFDPDIGDGPDPIDEIFGSNDTAVRYQVRDPSGTPVANLICNSGACAAARFSRSRVRSPDTGSFESTLRAC